MARIRAGGKSVPVPGVPPPSPLPLEMQAGFIGGQGGAKRVLAQLGAVGDGRGFQEEGGAMGGMAPSQITAMGKHHRVTEAQGASEDK